VRRHARRRRSVLQRVHVVPVLVGRAHRALDAAIGQKSRQDDVFDASLTEEEVEVGGEEAAESFFAFDDEVGGLGCHGGVEFGGPGVFGEGFAFGDSGEDSGGGADFVVTLFECNGNMQNTASGIPHDIHQFGSIFNNVVLLDAFLHGSVQCTAFGSELVLELNEDKGRLGGVEFECHGR